MLKKYQTTRFPIFYLLTFGSVFKKNAQHFRFLSSDNAEYLLVCFCLLVYFFLAAPFYMWNLSSLLRIKPSPPALEMQSLNHWITRGVPEFLFLI